METISKEKLRKYSDCLYIIEEQERIIKSLGFNITIAIIEPPKIVKPPKTKES